MIASNSVPDDAKDEFWSVVEDCLREFHALRQEIIRRKTRGLRAVIDQMKPGEVDAFYHAEPFDVACELAGKSVSVAAHLDRYLQIRDERHSESVPRHKSRRRRTG